jgi:hypothetical protein
MKRSHSRSAIRALEEARYGPQGLLNLRDNLPTAAEATRRATAWLSERQMLGVREVLIITGRGKGSPDGIPVIREAVRKVLHTLKRTGVVTAFTENGPGSFLVFVATLRSLLEAPRRRRHAAGRKGAGAQPANEPLRGLAPEVMGAMRVLAAHSLRSLGVPLDEVFLESEMRRQFTLLTRSLPTEGDRESLLASAVQRAIAEYQEH